MLEFVKKTVWSFEKDEMSRTSLRSFFLDGHRKDVVELKTNGMFKKLLTYDILLDRYLAMEQCVVIGKDVFRDARVFYNNPENRKYFLPIVNEKGRLLSFMQWNMQKKEVKVPWQKSTQIEGAKKIFIKECNEYTFAWIQNFLQRHSGKKIILSKEWTALFYGQVLLIGENEVSLYTGNEEVRDALELDFHYIPQFKVNTIKSMWKLKEDYVSYRIFVWLENEGDIDVFTHLSFSGIKIQGFCNEQAEGLEFFFEKQIVKVVSIINEPDVIIVYGKGNARKAELQKKYSLKKSLVLSYEELFEVRKEMRKKKNVILYDSVKAAKSIAKSLEERNVEIVGSCAVMGKTAGNIFPEKEVFEQTEILDNKYNIVLASTRLYCEESILGLQNRNIDFFVPSKDIFYSTIIITLWGKMALNLNKALKNGKKVFLYGTTSCYTNAWLLFLYTVGIKLEKILDDCENEEISVKNVYELAYENPKNTYIVLNKKIGKWEEACDLLENMGFAFNEMYTGLYAVSYRHLPKLTDITLGHVTSALLNDTKYEGFRIYGEETEGKYRIVTLGGSTTTSEAYRVVCWPQILYEKLTQMGYGVIVYNGAVDGYTASDELHKLIRDVRCLMPDLVISFSGINNRFKVPYPYVSAYLLQVFEEIYSGSFCKGLANESMSMAQVWVQQEQMMEAICKNVYHAKFVCFAQPMYVSKNVLSPWERLQFEKNSLAREKDLNYRKEISDLARQFEWMIDLQSFLDNYPDVFMDEAHVYKEGNQMIAEEIYKHIIDDIPKLTGNEQ